MALSTRLMQLFIHPINITQLQMMCKSGLSHIITMDLHQKEIQGFFDCPVDNLRASPFLLQYIQESVSSITNITRQKHSHFKRQTCNRFQTIVTLLLLLEILVQLKKQPHMRNDFVWELLLFMANKRNRKVMKSMEDTHRLH